MTRLNASIPLTLLLWSLFVHSSEAENRGDDRSSSPNVIVVFIDDLGYGDISPFGAPKERTPNLDRMASEGRRFSDFVVSSAVCSASRAALLTGCFHPRVSIHGALGPKSKTALSENEVTIAELCKQKGYATACVGKWHLGHTAVSWPTRHGFDYFFGLPYSNDMWPLHPDFAKLPPDAVARKSNYPPLPLIENNTIADPEVSGEDQSQLTKWYTEKSIEFIRQNKDHPFFLYLPHSMVHVPLFASESFQGKTQQGLYADVVAEVDWSVGRILETLKELGLDEKTLVIFSSDNGPWLSYGDYAGNAGPFREGKGTSWEGGVRVPTVMRWPNKIPAGTQCDRLASTVDLLPTIAAIVGADLPTHPIDGKDIRPLMFEDHPKESPHDSIPYYYASNELQAVRTQRWKLILPHKYRSLQGRPGGTAGTPASYATVDVGLELYDLENDCAESKNVMAEYPEIADSLQLEADRWRAALGDSLTNVNGSEVRPAASIELPIE